MAVKHTVEQRKALILEFKSSGKTISDWCKERGIGKSTLSKWLKDTAYKPKPEQNWIPVQINSLEIKDTLTIEIGRCKIKVDASFSKPLLAEIIKVLVAVC